VLVDGEHVEVVEPERERLVHSVRLESSGPVPSVGEHVVNARTSPLRKRAPAKSITALFCPVSLAYPNYRERDIYC
jgi:hypothetical protein